MDRGRRLGRGQVDGARPAAGAVVARKMMSVMEAPSRAMMTRDRPSSCPSWLVGEHPPSIAAVGCSGSWPLSLAKTGLHPRKALGPAGEDEYHGVHVAGPCRMRSSAPGARPVL